MDKNNWIENEYAKSFLSSFIHEDEKEYQNKSNHETVQFNPFEDDNLMKNDPCYDQEEYFEPKSISTMEMITKNDREILRDKESFKKLAVAIQVLLITLLNTQEINCLLLKIPYNFFSENTGIFEKKKLATKGKLSKVNAISYAIIRMLGL